ncbi:MAG TPA: hypothetical protein DIV79_13090 [Opitutae bacterium]|nr:hypothetical protein [Opitutaceae bacterium]HCR30941.1 hypothetical protein [Opitutae bacterium]
MPNLFANDCSDREFETFCSYQDFVERNEVVSVPRTENPDVSIIIPLRNSPEFLLNSIGALSRGEAKGIEAIVVAEKRDLQNYSKLESLVEGVCFCRVDEIASMSQAWNEGASQARSPFLLFMKEDARLLEGSLEALVLSFPKLEGVGAVGGMHLDSEEELIEAGGLLFNSGHCRSFGRGWNPDDFRVQYRREVAYCSGAALLVKRTVFEEAGGFDLLYSDEYYEDVDLCLRIADTGNRVVYDPEFRIQRHLEYRYDWSRCAQLLESNRNVLLRHREASLGSLPSESAYPVEVFFEKAQGKRILWIEDAPPFSHMGAGFPRTRAMLDALIELGHSVTLLPTFWTKSDYADVYRDTPREVEVALGIGNEGFSDFWQKRKDHYDAVIISRPNNLNSLGSVVFDSKRSRPYLKVIYDAEAIFANREINERRLQGMPLSIGEEKALLQKELGAAIDSDSVFAISETERAQLEDLGFPRIRMLRHYSEIRLSPRGFNDRSGILFVGAVHSDDAPNAVGLIDFIENSLPLIRQRSKENITLYCMGKYNSENLLKYATDTERFLGFVENLDEWYNRCRIFIAPAQLAAGIPLKIIEAASRGIPVVGSRLAQKQLEWGPEEMLSGDSGYNFAEACLKLYNDENLWSCLRRNAMDRVKRDYSHQSIVDALRSVLG